MDNLIIFCAKYLIFVISLIVFVYWLIQSRPRKLRLAFTIILGAVIATILVKVTGKLYYNPRPFAIENIQPLVQHGIDNGFPSEHATYSAVLAVSAYLFNRRLGISLFVLAVIVAWGRVAAHVHHPIDVVAGLFFGAAAAWLGYKLAVKLLKKKQPAIKPAAKEL